VAQNKHPSSKSVTKVCRVENLLPCFLIKQERFINIFRKLELISYLLQKL